MKILTTLMLTSMFACSQGPIHHHTQGDASIDTPKASSGGNPFKGENNCVPVVSIETETGKLIMVVPCDNGPNTSRSPVSDPPDWEYPVTDDDESFDDIDIPPGGPDPTPF